MKNFDAKGFTVFAIATIAIFCVTRFCCSPEASAQQSGNNAVHQCVLQDVKHDGGQAYIAGMPCVMDNETAALAFQIKRRGGTQTKIECYYTVENGVATLHLK